MQFGCWYTGSDNIFYRTPNHLNPIKRSIAKNVKFPEINFSEDKIYSDKIYRMIKTEEFITEPIYYYIKHRGSITEFNYKKDLRF